MTAPPGWYASDVPGMDRWWDGQQWTQHLQPTPQWAQPVRWEPKSKAQSRRDLWVWIGITVALAVFVWWLYS